MSSILPQSALLRRDLAELPRAAARARAARPARRGWSRTISAPTTASSSRSTPRATRRRSWRAPARLLPRLQGVQLEMPLVRCYEGERDFRDLFDDLGGGRLQPVPVHAGLLRAQARAAAADRRGVHARGGRAVTRGADCGDRARLCRPAAGGGAGRAWRRPPATTATAARIAELRAGRDRTGEVGDAALAASALVLTDDPAGLAGHTVFILTVPTPVDAAQPCPTSARCVAACRAIAPALAQGAVVVLESTVYPGATEEVVGPTLAALSGLAAGARLLPRLLARAHQSGRPRAHARPHHQGGRRPDPGGRGAPRRDLPAGSPAAGSTSRAICAPPRPPRRSRMRSATSTSRSSTRSR